MPLATTQPPAHWKAPWTGREKRTVFSVVTVIDARRGLLLFRVRAAVRVPVPDVRRAAWFPQLER